MTGINEWCITRLLEQTPCKKHLWIVTAVLLKNKTTLLSMPDPGDNIYVLIDRTRLRNMLTVHHSISPRSYNKIPANSIIVYALISKFLYIIRKKKLYHLYHTVIANILQSLCDNIQVKTKYFIQQTSNNQICEGFTGIFTIFADCSTIFHIFSSICRKIWNLNITVIKPYL